MKKIVLMEDDAVQAKALGELLEFSGYNVVTTATDEEAFSALSVAPIADLLITDIYAPVGVTGRVERGMTLIHKVRTAENEGIKSMPIISISGIRFPLTQAYSFDDPNAFGSDAHLAKPVDLERLLNTIDDVLENAPRAKRA